MKSLNICNSRLFERFQKDLKILIEKLAPQRLLERVKRVLESVIGIKFVNFLQQNFQPSLSWLRHDHELNTRKRLEAVQPECV